MKKLIISLLVLALISGFSVYLIYSKVQEKQQKRDSYEMIPSFHLLDLQGGYITQDSLKANTPVLFLFFDPECVNCKEEFEQIKAYHTSFSDFQIVLVSTLPQEIIKTFLQQIEFEISDNMFVLWDRSAELSKQMDVKAMPSSLIYNKNGQLTKHYAGQVKAETLIKCLSE